MTLLRATFRRSFHWLRRGARAVGYDIVRYRELPHDLDPEIARTVEAVRPYTMTSALRIAALCESVRHVVEAGISGDIVECGVWRGGSMMAVAQTLLRLGDRDRQLYLFDTFEGMTAPGAEDVSLTGERATDLMASERDRTSPDSVWCEAPLATVRSALVRTGYPDANVHFVQGRVEDTLPTQAPKRIALLRLDTDWYESTRHELEHLYPRLVAGGVLIIDDYGHWQGARKAVDEYIARHRLPLMLHRIDYSGRCAIKPE
jgi:hypothetical protein